MNEWGTLKAHTIPVWAFTFSYKFLFVSPFAPTNSQLSLNPSELMLVLPSSVISRFASSSNLLKRVNGFSWQVYPFFHFISGGHTLLQVHQKMLSIRWIRPRCCSGIRREVSPLQRKNKVKLIGSLMRQICALRTHLTRPTLTATVHVKVVGVCDFSCFTC